MRYVLHKYFYQFKAIFRIWKIAFQLRQIQPLLDTKTLFQYCSWGSEENIRKLRHGSEQPGTALRSVD